MVSLSVMSSIIVTCRFARTSNRVMTLGSGVEWGGVGWGGHRGRVINTNEITKTLHIVSCHIDPSYSFIRVRLWP